MIVPQKPVNEIHMNFIDRFYNLYFVKNSFKQSACHGIIYCVTNFPCTAKHFYENAVCFGLYSEVGKYDIAEYNFK